MGERPLTPLPEVSPGVEPAKVLVMATLVIPSDEGAPLETIEAYIYGALRDHGFFVKRVDAEFFMTR